MISAIVLAAGLSSRMNGKNKLLLEIENKKLIQKTLEAVIASEVMEVIVVVGHQKNQIIQLIEENSYPVKVVENKNYKTGMTSSIQIGIENASPFADGIMICMGDMPLLETSHYNSIILAFRKEYLTNPDCIAIPYFDSRRGNPVIFSSKYKEDLLKHSKPEGCRDITDSNPGEIVKVPLSTNIKVLDVDKIEDYITLA